MKVSNRSERCKAGARSDTCFCMILYRLRLTEHSSRCFMQPHAEATWQAFVSGLPRPVRSLWCPGAACPRTPDRLARAGWSSSSPAPGDPGRTSCAGIAVDTSSFRCYCRPAFHDEGCGRLVSECEANRSMPLKWSGQVGGLERMTDF